MEQEVRQLKRLFKDPNPLFRKWLSEWKEEAERKDTRMKYVYGMALKSLRQYPMPLTSGKSCNILKGFGTTLCTRLDERLQKHIDQHGPLPALGVRNQVEINNLKQKAPAKKRAPKTKPSTTLPESEPGQPTTDGSSNIQSGRRTDEYRPRPGSGGFALLLAMRGLEQKPGYAGFLRKSALQEAAQPLCTASMALPEAGGYYTAWSTMTALVKRKLVLREGNPARFSLTETGRELADQLATASCAVPSQRHCFDRLASPGDRPPSPATPAQPAAGFGRLVSHGTDSAGHDPEGALFAYQYVSSSGARVSTKDEAHDSLHDGRAGFLARCRRDALDAGGRSYWPDPSRPDRDGVVHVFLVDSDCAAVCPAGPLPGPSHAAVPRTVPGLGTAAGPPRSLHDMSDSDSDGELASCHDQSQSASRSLPQFQTQSQPGSSQKRQPTDWGAALKRLRTVGSDGARPTAASSSSSAGFAPASSSGATPLSDEDCHLLSDDDDAMLLTGSATPSPPSPSSSEDGNRLTLRVQPAASRPTEPVSPPATDGAGASDAGRLGPPMSPARLMKERAAAAAEARASGRPPPAATSVLQRPVITVWDGLTVKADDTSDRSVTESTADSAEGPAQMGYFSPTVVLQPGTFDVVLCVDNQETSGNSGPVACLHTYRDVMLAELQKNGVVVDVRKLSVGDFLWVARPHTDKQPEELVLPFIVERKRLDDLASSIRDSRYREQKFRLKRCGLPTVIYLAEAMGSGPRPQRIGLPESTLQQALANCQVVDGFRVKWTADQRETAAFLTLMTRRLERQYQCRQLEGCPRDLLPVAPPSLGRPERLQLFSEFHQLSAKRQRLTAGSVFAKMLLQLSGLSVDKAAAIVPVYPTVARLVDAYGRCRTPSEAEGLLAPLRADKSGRPVGAAISRAVYRLYCDQHLS